MATPIYVPPRPPVIIIVPSHPAYSPPPLDCVAVQQIVTCVPETPKPGETDYLFVIGIILIVLVAIWMVIGLSD